MESVFHKLRTVILFVVRIVLCCGREYPDALRFDLDGGGGDAVEGDDEAFAALALDFEQGSLDALEVAFHHFHAVALLEIKRERVNEYHSICHLGAHPDEVSHLFVAHGEVLQALSGLPGRELQSIEVMFEAQ